MRLNNGQRLPDLAVQTLDGREMKLPADVEEGWACVLFYRGHW